MPPRGIPAAVRRELDARFQEQNELLERMMRRLEALDNQAPASPEPAEVVAAEDEAPAPGEPALGLGASGRASSCSCCATGGRTCL